MRQFLRLIPVRGVIMYAVAGLGFGLMAISAVWLVASKRRNCRNINTIRLYKAIKEVEKLVPCDTPLKAWVELDGNRIVSGLTFSWSRSYTTAVWRSTGSVYIQCGGHEKTFLAKFNHSDRECQDFLSLLVQGVETFFNLSH